MVFILHSLFSFVSYSSFFIKKKTWARWCCFIVIRGIWYSHVSSVVWLRVREGPGYTVRLGPNVSLSDEMWRRELRSVRFVKWGLLCLVFKHVSDVGVFCGLDFGLCIGLVRILRGMGYLPGKLGNLIQISETFGQVVVGLHFGLFWPNMWSFSLGGFVKAQ